MGTVSQGLNALKDAFEISKTEMERAKVLALREETQTKERQVQKAVDDRFRTEVVKFHGRLQSLDPDAPDYTNQLAKLKADAEALKDRKWLSLDLAGQLVDPVLGEIAEMQKQDQLARAEASYLLSIRQAVGDPGSYRARLDAYVQDPRFVGTPRHRQFQQVLKNEASLWAGFEEWSLLKRSLSGTNLAKYDPKNVRPLLTRANGVLEMYPGFPDEPALKEIVEYLKVLLLRDQGNILRAAESVLNRPIVRSLYMLETKDGKKYYSTKIPAALGNTHFTIRYAVDIALDDEKTLTVKKEEIKNPLLAGGQSFDFESPQMKFSKFAKDKIDEISADPSKWEEVFLEVLANLSDDKKMDEFVKFNLIKAMDEFASLGSVYLKQQLQPDRENLAKAGAEIDTNANWIDPDNEEGKKSAKSPPTPFASSRIRKNRTRD